MSDIVPIRDPMSNLEHAIVTAPFVQIANENPQVATNSTSKSQLPTGLSLRSSSKGSVEQVSNFSYPINFVFNIGNITCDASQLGIVHSSLAQVGGNNDQVEPKV